MIDLMKNEVPNDAEIEAAMQAIINEAWPPSKREKVIRTNFEKDALDAFFVGMSAMKTQAIADRDLLSETLKYEAAVARLAQYQLSVGKPEQVIVTDIQETGADGLPVFDAAGNPVMVTETIPAIDPLPATILDDIGGEIPNPAIVQDDAERAEAQAVVDGATQDVINLAGQRGA